MGRAARGRGSFLARGFLILSVSIGTLVSPGSGVAAEPAALPESANLLATLNQNLPEQQPAAPEPGLGELPNVDARPADAAQPGGELYLPESSQEDIDVVINGVRRGGQKWRVIPHAILRAGYDDNIFITPDHKQSDAFFVIAPGLAAGWGDFRRELKEYANFQQRFDLDLEEQGEIFDTRRYFFANYTPSVTLFATHRDQDSLDHDGVIAAQWMFTKLTLGFRARIQTLSGSDIDVGERVKRIVSRADINSRYELGSRSSVEANFSFLHYDFKSAIDSTEWTNRDWFNYELFPRINVGAGFVIGRLDVQDGSFQTYEQGLFRAIYAASDKLYFNGQVGAEFRQISGGGPDRQTPVFSVGASWTPFPNTLITLGGSRAVGNSAGTAGDNIIATQIQGSIRQRFGRVFFLTVSGGYGISDYDQISSLTAPPRNDKGWSVLSSLAVDLTKWATLEAVYQFRENDSSVREFGFRENQVTLQLTMMR
jgi:hypothetical protein